MSYETYDEEMKQARERFAREGADHKMTVLHNEGLYRHIRMKHPQRSEYWYELVTWPGNLVFRGDGTSFAFSRATDMFAFFAHGLRKDGTIDIEPQYWEEKITSDRDNIQGWDSELFVKDLWTEVASIIESGAVHEDQEQRFRAEVQEMLDCEQYDTCDLALRMLDDFNFWNDKSHEHDYRYRSEAVQFTDSWEWVPKCTTYDWWYLWACHGIVHGVKEFYAVYGCPSVAESELGKDTWDVARHGVPVG